MSRNREAASDSSPEIASLSSPRDRSHVTTGQGYETGSRCLSQVVVGIGRPVLLASILPTRNETAYGAIPRWRRRKQNEMIGRYNVDGLRPVHPANAASTGGGVGPLALDLESRILDLGLLGPGS